MGKDDEWFRNSRWSAEVEVAFLARLERSKSVYSKAQYARIKALMLEQTGDPVRVRAAINLLTRIPRDWPSEHEVASCQWQLARCHLVLGDIDSALDHFQQCLRREREHQTQTGAWCDFSLLVVSRNLLRYYPKVLAVLEENEDETLFPIHGFVIHACRALIAWENKSWIEAQREAEKALEQSVRPNSGLARHPDLGLVRGQEKLIGRLQSIVDDEEVRRDREKTTEPGHLATKEPDDEAEKWDWKLMVQLGELGIKAKSVFDLVNGPANYDHALPLLLRFLPTIPRKPRLNWFRKGVLRALSVPAFRRQKNAIVILMAVFHKADDDEELWLLARQIGALAKKEHANFLINAALAEKNGTARSYLLGPLRNLAPDKAVSVFLKILKQPHYLVPVNILVALAKCNDSSAVAAIKPYLESEDPDWRKAAMKAMKLIRAR